MILTMICVVCKPSLKLTFSGELSVFMAGLRNYTYLAVFGRNVSLGVLC
jgi:hypothetical protein